MLSFGAFLSQKLILAILASFQPTLLVSCSKYCSISPDQLAGNTERARWIFFFLLYRGSPEFVISEFVIPAIS